MSVVLTHESAEKIATVDVVTEACLFFEGRVVGLAPRWRSVRGGSDSPPASHSLPTRSTPFI